MGTGTGYRKARSVYIEYLEKRIAPATFIVTNLNDAGTGSLRQAVLNANAAPGADIIVFRGAATSGEIELTSGEIDITDSVNIRGPGAGQLIIDAQNESRIFNINDGTVVVKRIAISGLSMVAGTAGPGSGSPGGGIYTEESLTLINSVVSGCEAPAGSGGGVFASTPGRVVITNSKITGNTAAIDGAGLWLQANAGIQVTNSLVSGNTAASDGGGIYAHITPTGTGDILLQGVRITNNSAGLTGGGAFLDNDRVNGIGAEIGRTIVRTSLVTGNNASTASGGIHLNDGNALIDRSTISNNTAIENGGGITDNSLPSLTIRNSRIIDNLAASDSPTDGGGGIYIVGDQHVTIQRSLIAGNSTFANGGGILATLSNITILGSTVSGNLAGGDGGGVSTRSIDLGGTGLRVEGSLFAENRAGNTGGGIDTRGDGNVTILSSRFLNNNAEATGGGLYLRTTSSRISITNSLISENTARDDGGGLALNWGDGGSASVANTVITNNVAAGDDGGGVAIFNAVDSITFRASRVTGNVAVNQGGGIYTAGALVTLVGTIVTGNTAPIDPQIVTPA